jgi:hypothetical protein
MALLGSIGVLLSWVVVFYILINVSFFYDARHELAADTGRTLSPDSHIDHFMVHNFFFVDGPDYYYELSLAPTDRARLIESFFPGGQAEALNGNADDYVPASWRNGSTAIRRYCLHRPEKNQILLLAVDTASDKAWLVIENL